MVPCGPQKRRKHEENLCLTCGMDGRGHPCHGDWMRLRIQPAFFLLSEQPRQHHHCHGQWHFLFGGLNRGRCATSLATATECDTRTIKGLFWTDWEHYFRDMNRVLLSVALAMLCTTSLTLSAQSGDNINMNMSIGADGEQMNMNMSIDADGEQMNMNMSIDADDIEEGFQNDNWEPDMQAQPATTAPPTSRPQPAAFGPSAMGSLDFERYLAAIKSKTFEDSKLKTAKAPLRGQYLNAEQIGMVMKAFDFEATRLDFAVLAHPRCVDPSNYYLIYDAFDFELSIDELEEALGH